MFLDKCEVTKYYFTFFIEITGNNNRFLLLLNYLWVWCSSVLIISSTENNYKTRQLKPNPGKTNSKIKHEKDSKSEIQVFHSKPDQWIASSYISGFFYKQVYSKIAVYSNWPNNIFQFAVITTSFSIKNCIHFLKDPQESSMIKFYTWNLISDYNRCSMNFWKRFHWNRKNIMSHFVTGSSTYS